MDEKDFEVLTDLVMTCNISKTAQRLYTTQSAVTKRLQKMEAELGIELFVRSNKGLLPTPALQGMLPELRSAVEAVGRIRNYAASCNGEIMGTLRMGISVNYSRYRLPEVLSAYMEKYPRVDVHIEANRSPHIYQSLMNGEISFAIVRGEYAWRGGDIILSEDHHCLVRSRQHADTPLNDLAFIARESDPGYMAELSTWMRRHNLNPSHAALIINDVETIMTMVEQGLGWSVLPDICLDRFDGIVLPIQFSNGERFARRTHILYRPDYLLLPQVKAFIEMAQEVERKRKGEAAGGDPCV